MVKVVSYAKRLVSPFGLLPVLPEGWTWVDDSHPSGRIAQGSLGASGLWHNAMVYVMRGEIHIVGVSAPKEVIDLVWKRHLYDEGMKP